MFFSIYYFLCFTLNEILIAIISLRMESFQRLFLFSLSMSSAFLSLIGILILNLYLWFIWRCCANLISLNRFFRVCRVEDEIVHRHSYMDLSMWGWRWDAREISGCWGEVWIKRGNAGVNTRIVYWRCKIHFLDDGGDHVIPMSRWAMDIL